MTHRNQATRCRASVGLPAPLSARRASRSLQWLKALALPALLLAGHVHAQSCAVGETPAAFGFTGGEQTLVVPAGVTSARVFLSGAQGGAGRSGAGTIGGSPNSPGGTGGLGGRVSGTLAVTPGSTLSIFVGGQASQAVNGGGIGQGVDGIGGGGTDIRVGGNAIGNRAAIAGGGGGGGNAGWSTTNVIAGGNGGVGGGGIGGTGAAVPGGPGPFGGGGGSVGTGGAAGGGCGGFPPSAGNAINGDGGDSYNFSGSFSGAGFGGGGGGGATVGAGGGGAGVGTTACQQNWNGGGGGGAGGSSAATGLTAVTINNGVQSGNGAALICLAAADFELSGTATGQTGPVTLQLAATNPVSSQQVVVAQAAATFAFPTRLPPGANWNVSVVSAPAGQLCSITPTSGTNLAGNVTNLALTCQTVAVTVSPATLPDAAFGAPYSQTITASSSNGGTAPYTFTLSAGALPGGVTLAVSGVLSGTPTSAGTYNFTVQATSTNGFSGTRAYSLVVATGSQAITAFSATPASPVFAPGGTFTVSATGGASGNPVVFGTTTSAVCTVSGNTVTMVSAGACSLTANQAGNGNYTAAPQAALNVAIGQAVQVITNFVATPGAPVYAPGGSFTVAATGGASTSPVLFATTTPAVCTVSGNTVTTMAAGVCALTANQAADGNYTAAPQATLNVTISQAAQAITAFSATPAAPVYSPGGTFALSATAGASTSPLVFAGTSPAVCTVSGSTVTMVAAGNCALTANQAGDANYTAAPQVTLNVVISAATPTLTWIGNLTRTMGQPSFDLPNPTSTSSGTFTFSSTNTSVATVVGRTVTLVGDGVTTLVATQAAAGSYLQGTVSITLTVSDRPDPTQDPSVVGGLQAQVDASLRFAQAQQTNIRDRLRQQRNNPANVSSNGLSLASTGAGGGSVSLDGAPQSTSNLSSTLPPGWAVWSAGVVSVGGRDNRASSDGTDFLSDGITLGADWRINDRWLVGFAGGFGWDSTSLDDSRSDIDGDQQSLSVYGLWHSGEHLFVDGLLGWGQLGFDITRWSDVAGAKATAERDGDQAFGSLTLGYERMGAHSSLTGYGRLDASRTRLDAYREFGLGIYDLAYGDQTVDMSSLAVGVEGSYVLTSSSGQVRPYWMLEYRDSLENTSDVALNYVLSPVAQDYRIGFTGYGENVFMYGAGLDVDVTTGWRLSLLFRREHASNYGANTMLGLLLSYSPRGAKPLAMTDANGQPLATTAPATGR